MKMRKLNNKCIAVIMIIWFAAITAMNAILIEGCMNGYYEGIYIIGVIMFMTFLTGMTTLLYAQLKEWRF